MAGGKLYNLDMSLRDKLKETQSLGDEGLEDVEELICDELIQLPELSKADQTYLEKFSSLQALSMNGLGLEKLATLPALPMLVRVLLSSRNTAARAERQLYSGPHWPCSVPKARKTRYGEQSLHLPSRLGATRTHPFQP